MDMLMLVRRMMTGGSSVSSEPNYLRFTALQDSSSVSLNETGTPPTLNLEYRINKGDWTSYTYGTAISLDNGDYMEMRNADDIVRTQVSSATTKQRRFAMSGSINASGNIMSLLDKTCESLTVGYCCFYGLFYGCASLKTAPIVPATILNQNCYYSMFQLSGIVNAPYMPATTLYRGCYNSLYLRSQIINCRFASLNTSTYVLYQATSLQYIEVEASEPPTINTNTFSGASGSIIYVPDASVDAYKAAQYWSDRASYIKGISERQSN